MIKTTIIFAILNCIILTNSFDVPNNPCPTIFEYIYNGKGWFGHVTVPAPPPRLNVAKISVNFSIENTITNYGPIKLDEPDKAIEKIKKGYPLTFIITLPKSKYLPRVTQIEYNGNILCYGSSVPAPSTLFWLQYTFNWTGVFNTQNTPIIYYDPPHQTPRPHVTYSQKPIYELPQQQVTYSTKPIIYQPPTERVTYSPKPIMHHRPPEQVTYSPKPITYQPSIIFEEPPIYTSKPKTKTTATTTTTAKPKKFSNYKECGFIRKKRSTEKDDIEPYVYNGTPIASNSHPWLAALFDVQRGRRPEFFCAGNLISTKHVLTAAHCTTAKIDINIEIKLGVHNTKNLFDPGTQKRRVKIIIKHPEYQQGNAHADMSFIVLDEDVVFTQAIKPICLWNYNTDFRAIVGYPGTIMGWGLQENGEQSTVPMKTEVTITTKQRCKEIDLLRNLVTDETFCAGRKGTGPCMGDSGGGLFIVIDGKWYLRGIISTSIADRKTQVCDVNTYSIYVDTAQYMNWIMDNMDYD